MASSVSLPSEGVLIAARAQLKSIYEQREIDRAEFVRGYYRNYVLWAKFCRLFPWNRGKDIQSFEDYLAGFNGDNMGVCEGMRYHVACSYAWGTVSELKEVIALCEASVDGTVTLGPDHCLAIGYPKQPLPLTRRQEELAAARRELDESTSIVHNIS